MSDIYEALERAVAEVSSPEDPLTRCREAHKLMVSIEEVNRNLAPVRRAAIDQLVGPGGTMTARALAEDLGVSERRIGQIRTAGGGPAPERAFFGGADTITVAVAEKLEAGKAKPMPVVSIDDVQAYDRLRILVEGLNLNSTYEVVKPPGNVLLNRDGLVLICGPRHSSIIAQVLESDDHLAFDKDENGWHLVDRTAGVTYRSPEDGNLPGDIAYFGRLPRVDGKGYFLYIAGIHSSGSAGAVHYLCNELPNLYREVKARPFSMLVQCEYDPASHEIVSSRRITPIYKG